MISAIKDQCVIMLLCNNFDRPMKVTTTKKKRGKQSKTKKRIHKQAINWYPCFRSTKILKENSLVRHQDNILVFYFVMLIKCSKELKVKSAAANVWVKGPSSVPRLLTAVNNEALPATDTH